MMGRGTAELCFSNDPHSLQLVVLYLACVQEAELLCLVLEGYSLPRQVYAC